MKAPARLLAPGTRWVVDCPRELCANAYRVWPGDPPTFLDADVDENGNRYPIRRPYGKAIRCDCTDDTVDMHDIPCGQLIHPVFPLKIPEGLAALAKRPPQHRNWLPGERVEDLIAENIEHGVEVP